MTAQSILMIDDSPEDREHIARLIASSERGWAVQAAESGDEGVALCRANAPDCVLLDNRLEAEDGLDVLPKLKELNRFCPVIMLTGLGSDAIAIEAIKRGASDYLVKTELSHVSLVTTIGNAMQRATLERRLSSQQIENQRQQDRVRWLEKALNDLKSMSSAGSATSVTRTISGAGPVRERAPDVFGQLAQNYEALMDDYLQQLVVEAPKPIREMKTIAQTLGSLGGGPRDLLDIHLAALETAAVGVNPARSEAYSVEGRLMALEMMGLLVDYYRTGLGPRSD